MFDSGCLDLDLTVLGGLILDLIQAVAYGSGGPGQRGAGAAAGRAGDVLPRRRAAGGGQSRPSRGGFERDWGLEAPMRHA